MIGSDEGIKLESTNGKVFSTIIGNVDGINLWNEFGTYIGSLDKSLDGSNDGTIKKLLL